ncbi:phosphopantetheine-binding protein [Dickeya fangzhongdai]|uniref:acyl carrier protein n=1 Tax=Dickeya fangzhongdai TaxID=1778540 RepID=UPI001369BE61|nr:phosphopantetheine-binding protein [Dickeya fangzhongdai]UMB76974.1 phosphopantetheine-binding protein [Dickeya fangzhongdai]
MSFNTDYAPQTGDSPDFYYQKIVTAIGIVLETDDLSELHPHTDLERDLGFESGIFIELMMYLEEMIEGLSIDPVTLDSQQISTIDSLGRFIHSQLEHGVPCA